MKNVTVKQAVALAQAIISLVGQPAPKTDSRPKPARQRKPRQPRRDPAQWRNGEADRREKILAAWNTLITNGQSRGKAAAALKISVPTLWRWSKKFHRAGRDGLIPATYKCGRKPSHAKRQAMQAEAAAKVQETSPAQ